MTTMVKIQAHVSADKEVRATIIENGGVTEEFSMQNGEIAERYVYDGREISVKEVLKAADPA